jgi:drug/metabolite transporter (DMT)-like permease
MSNLIPILIVIFLTAVGVVGDYFIKSSGSGQKYISYPHFFIGMIIYALTAFGWFYVMKHIKLSTLGVFFALTNIILLALLGVIFFKEHLTVYEIVGIILGVISIIILARFG